MSRIFFIVCFVLIQTTVFADDDKPITVDRLPQKSQQFIEKHFTGLKVAYAKMENEIFGKSYEIVFTDGSKVEFDKKGEWTDVDCKFGQVPVNIIPQGILDYVTANHKGTKVVDIDRDSRDYELKLDNGIELKFDLKFNLIGYDH